MKTRFNLLQFLGDMLFVAAGTALAASITLLTAWLIATESSIPFQRILLSFLGSFCIGMVFSMPIVALVLLSGHVIKVALPVIDPAGIAMVVVLGLVGVGFSLLLATLYGLPSMGEFGSYAVLATAVGGGVTGILAARKIQRQQR